MRNENRYEQYDVNIDLPPPLVPRSLRRPVTERIDARGRILTALNEDDVVDAARRLREADVQAVAVGFLHSYVNASHEERAGEILAGLLPDVEISLSSEVSPEMREFERLSTACANAYVQPLMSRHLDGLEVELERIGLRCPLHLMLSGGGLTTLATARRFPVRLVESGPAGGAIFAGSIARQLGYGDVLSYDMGGTTAKICLIQNGHPQTSRSFEVARMYRFMRGSGLPLRIPVIEMVEIGAGGGSIAHLDAMGRIAVGPESAGSDPGPVAYGLGGSAPTVTDADVVLGKIDPDNFADGRMPLDASAAAEALLRVVGTPLALDAMNSALGVAEIVDENMSNAARVHTVESGQRVETKTMIAFGGAAPLHAARLAEKLSIRRVVIPPGAGVGSAIGFLRAPVAYEVTRTYHQQLSSLDADGVNALLDAMRAEATPIVLAGAPGHDLQESRLAYMRYIGQGHEVGVELPISIEAAVVDESSPAAFLAAYEGEYERLYGRAIPGVDVEILSWVLTVSTGVPAVALEPAAASTQTTVASDTRGVMDAESGTVVQAGLFARALLSAGDRVEGPAIIVEANTSTLVTSSFTATIAESGHIIMEARDE
jgi:N-methylhydantoinase A